jgi:hypothetical protein
MPGIGSLEALQRAVSEFRTADIELAIDSSAHAAARRSLDESGLLLLGETPGVRENPLLARALMTSLGITGLALEWPTELAPAISDFLAGSRLPDHDLLWSGEGRITAGHLAVLQERIRADRLQALTLFDGTTEVGWSRREAAMADRILAARSPESGTLVVAGDAHTPTTPTTMGMPLGARLAEKRRGVREIRVRYGSGEYYNLRTREFKKRFGFRKQVRLHIEQGQLILDLPAATEAAVPHRVMVAGPAGAAR